jgi:hypothetical protein
MQVVEWWEYDALVSRDLAIRALHVLDDGTFVFLNMTVAVDDSAIDLSGHSAPS